MEDRGSRHTRDGYADALLELGESNPHVVVMDADLAVSTQTYRFKEKFPGRFFDCGVAEQNLMGTAAGLATTGKIVFASTFAVFAAGRAYDQVRNTIAHSKLNVKICATHGGVSVGEDGSSHQSVEDIALMRVIPNMKVIVPADYYEAREATRAAAEIPGPIFIRLGRMKAPVIFDEGYAFEFGRARVLRPGRDISIFACGLMTYQSLLAAEILEGEGLDAEVVHLSTIKPLDAAGVLTSVKKTGRALSVEEHSVIGGLGGALAELLSTEMPVSLQRMGVPDAFGTSGTSEELLEHFSLTPRHIAQVAMDETRRPRS
jgi:transketolase